MTADIETLPRLFEPTKTTTVGAVCGAGRDEYVSYAETVECENEACNVRLRVDRDDFRCTACQKTYCQSCAEPRLRHDLGFEEEDESYCQRCSDDKCIFCCRDGNDVERVGAHDWKAGSVCARCLRNMSTCAWCDSNWPGPLLHVCATCGTKQCDRCWLSRRSIPCDYYSESRCGECARRRAVATARLAIDHPALRSRGMVPYPEPSEGGDNDGKMDRTNPRKRTTSAIDLAASPAQKIRKQ